jgi:hypothetical protein
MIQLDCKIAFSPREAAEACSVSLHAIRLAIRSFDLTPHKINRASVLTRDDLIAWIERQPRFVATRERKALSALTTPSSRRLAASGSYSPNQKGTRP